jgi:hypothetical protein
MQTLQTIQGPGVRSTKKKLTRLVIYPKDVQIITGKSHRTACRILRDIRLATGKSKHQLISIEEFCLYMRMDKGLVTEFLND